MWEVAGFCGQLHSVSILVTRCFWGIQEARCAAGDDTRWCRLYQYCRDKYSIGGDVVLRFCVCGAFGESYLFCFFVLCNLLFFLLSAFDTFVGRKKSLLCTWWSMIELFASTKDNFIWTEQFQVQICFGVQICRPQAEKRRAREWHKNQSDRWG